MSDLKPRTSAQHGRLWGARARDWAELAERQMRPAYEAVLGWANVGAGTVYLDAASPTGAIGSKRRSAAYSPGPERYALSWIRSKIRPPESEGFSRRTRIRSGSAMNQTRVFHAMDPNVFLNAGSLRSR